MFFVKNTLRRILFERLGQESIDDFYKIYYRIRYPKEMGRVCSYGEINSDKVFYIIRPRSDGIEGLMSLFMNVVKNLYFAIEKGYIPVVDFENYHTQYDDDVDGEKNVWNFYFTQPSNYTLDEVYKSKNVILSGLEIQWYNPQLLVKSFDNNTLGKLHDFVFHHVSFRDNVLKMVNQEILKMNINLSNTLGLYLRGTDYIALKPSGHPIQPTMEQATTVVDIYMEKYEISNIFLVTEDEHIYKNVRRKYGEICVFVSYDSFISNYGGKKYLSHDKSIKSLGCSAHERGMNYLVKLIILSKCAYFIGGDTMGSWATCIFMENAFKEKYIFNLGVYGK